jgi:hypothetical protein
LDSISDRIERLEGVPDRLMALETKVELAGQYSHSRAAVLAQAIASLTAIIVALIALAT